MNIVQVVLGNVLIFVLYLFLIALIGRLVFDLVQMYARSWRPAGLVLVLVETRRSSSCVASSNPSGWGVSRST